MYKRDSQSVGDILRAFLDENPHILQRLKADDVVRHAYGLFTPEERRYVAKISLSDGVLTIRSYSSVFRAHLHAHSREFLSRLQSEVGSGMVSSLRFR